MNNEMRWTFKSSYERERVDIYSFKYWTEDTMKPGLAVTVAMPVQCSQIQPAGLKLSQLRSMGFPV